MTPAALAPSIERIAAVLGLSGAAEPLRGGRTNRVWLCGDVVVKAYEPDAATPLFPNDSTAEVNALIALEAAEIAPEPLELTQVDGQHVLLYQALKPSGAALDPAAAGALLAKLHRQTPPEWLPDAHLGAAVLDQAKEMSAAPVPAWITAPDAPPKRVFLHRDPIAPNFLVTRDGLRLIDWQCPALGDPLEDIAHFHSPAMRVVYGLEPLKAAQQDAFFAGYDCATQQARYRAFGAAFHWRMAAYCRWQIARGEAAYAPGLAAELKLLAQIQAELAIAQPRSHVQKNLKKELQNGA